MIVFGGKVGTAAGASVNDFRESSRLTSGVIVFYPLSYSFLTKFDGHFLEFSPISMFI